MPRAPAPTTEALPLPSSSSAVRAVPPRLGGDPAKVQAAPLVANYPLRRASRGQGCSWRYASRALLGDPHPHDALALELRLTARAAGFIVRVNAQGAWALGHGAQGGGGADLAGSAQPGRGTARTALPSTAGSSVVENEGRGIGALSRRSRAAPRRRRQGRAHVETGLGPSQASPKPRRAKAAAVGRRPRNCRTQLVVAVDARALENLRISGAGIRLGSAGRLAWPFARCRVRRSRCAQVGGGGAVQFVVASSER